MTSILKSFVALYTSMLLLAMSLGLLATVLSLKLTIEGFSTQMTGMILTSYFIGSVTGAIYCRPLIRSVGHIRAFTAFAALATAMIMLHGFYISAFAWAVFRFFTGIATIGLFMVIESWFNECAQPQTRGRVFSIYMVMCYLGGSVGQQLLNIGDIKDQTLFFVIGFLLVSCIIPIALTHSIHPQMPKTEPVKLKIILKKAPLGILGCFTSGLASSSFYTMGPIFCHQTNLSVSQISYFMAITVLGGLLFQWPLGLFSDRFDRSKVIPVLGGVFAVISALMIVASQGTFWVFMAATAMFGGIMFTIYPAAVARAHDMFEPKDVVNVSSALLLFYGIGSVIGPIAASSVMGLLDTPYGFFIYF
ncbi:MAG: MFS transporter [Proteobacteria bacterium]|nr:MFS transporter [Pseudomonadota bacterium]